MYKKKSQITLFIILGMIILIGIGLFYYFGYYDKSSSTTSGEELLKRAPEELKPFIQFITQCIQEVSLEAVYNLAKGGYIDLKDPMYTQKGFTINQIDPTESDVFVIDEDLMIPYWYYMKSSNNCKICDLTTEGRPSLENIEEQINQFLKDNINECLKNLSSFTTNGFIINEGKGIGIDNHNKINQLQPVTKITSTNIDILLKLPIKVEKDSKVVSINEFQETVPINLMKIYNLAALIANGSMNSRYLEKITLSIIGYYSGINSNLLPPFGGINEDSVPVLWVLPAVQEQLQIFLAAYVPLITIENTKNAKKITGDDKYEALFFDNLYLKNPFNYSDLEVKFHYYNYPLYLYITPNEGALIKPIINVVEFPIELIPNIYVNNYNFYYDISFPVLVEIYDKKALGGKGYRFFFPLEANIKDNRDIMRWINGNIISDWNPEGRVTPQVTKGVNKEPSQVDLKTGEKMNNIIQDPVKKLFCDRDQRIGTNLYLTITDTKYKPIHKMSISYNCAEYDGCSLGATNITGEYSGKLPFCIGGILRLSNPNYKTKIIQINSTIDNEQNFELITDKIIKKNTTFNIISVETLKKDFSMRPSLKLDQLYIQQMRSKPKKLNPIFDKNFTATIIFTKERDNPFENIFTTSVAFTKDEEKEVSLLPGNYTVKAIFILKDKLVIPEEERDIGDSDSMKIPEIKLDTQFIGGVELNNNTGYWEVSENKLENAEKIIFYIFQLKTPQNTEDFNELNNLEMYSADYRLFIEPKMK